MKIMSAESEPDQASTATPPSLVSSGPRQVRGCATPFGRSPEFLGNRFVYAVISQRAHGLSIGINLNPDKCCNFDCAYCEVNRTLPAGDSLVDLDVLAGELERLLC